MPPTPKSKKNYTEQDVIEAVANIKNGTMKYREAAQVFKVPMSTLSDKVKERTPLFPGKLGNLLVIS